MRSAFKWVVCLLLCVVGPAMAGEAPPPESGDVSSPDALLDVEGLSESLTAGRLLEASRRVVDEGIAEYSYTVQVGPGAYDVITVHRVVTELLPGIPRIGQKPVFLVHGDLWGFRGAFLPSVESSAVPREKSFALYLARQGRDVWGVDLRWVHVPATTTDFTFMQNWNLETHLQDVRAGLLLANQVRTLGSSSVTPMPLLGWSRGATIGYALLNAEAKSPANQHLVSAFVPVDMAYVFDKTDAVQSEISRAACDGYTMLSALQQSGVYVEGSGQTVQGLGVLAITAPQAPSPLLMGLTNREAALLAGSATYMLQGVPLFDWYHFTGGLFSGTTPTGLTWTNERFFFDVMRQASPFQSSGEQVETLALWCGSPTQPYNDRLNKVKVPVLYVGAAGGVGELGLATLKQLGTKDKDLFSLIVRRLADSDRARDFGHADLFLASDADQLVWSHIANWLAHH
ncbi:hypothetical protein D187_002365 [Cystobacter fuscus DSM 2262]|uniref:Lipoprotein n=1 Tax=Cystobacter fuscus (strain ATCC 25194 / DSM 2262 / NBRC 100088 / M29) TaxID=1242864 RepID=S9QG47_CYSF2|nr:hypothetical protein [Cystobacter fuscus]EPX60279.1 hypothetical protein D187_002365 [Cystobacter fuscus DSM 2262]